MILSEKQVIILKCIGSGIAVRDLMVKLRTEYDLLNFDSLGMLVAFEKIGYILTENDFKIIRLSAAGFDALSVSVGESVEALKLKSDKI